MVVSPDSIAELFAELFEREHRNAVVYADAEGETILHEGPVRVLPTGWIELPSGRLLSPGAVHHIDVEPERPE